MDQTRSASQALRARMLDVTGKRQAYEGTGRGHDVTANTTFRLENDGILDPRKLSPEGRQRYYEAIRQSRLDDTKPDAIVTPIALLESERSPALRMESFFNQFKEKQ